MEVNNGEGSRSFANESQNGTREAKEILKRTMKMTYDTRVDVLRILFNNEPIEESDTIKPHVILDYDKDANVVDGDPKRIETNRKSSRSGIPNRQLA